MDGPRFDSAPLQRLTPLARLRHSALRRKRTAVILAADIEQKRVRSISRTRWCFLNHYGACVVIVSNNAEDSSRLPDTSLVGQIYARPTRFRPEAYSDLGLLR